MPRWSMWNIL